MHRRSLSRDSSVASSYSSDERIGHSRRRSASNISRSRSRSRSSSPPTSSGDDGSSSSGNRMVEYVRANYSPRSISGRPIVAPAPFRRSAEELARFSPRGVDVWAVPDASDVVEIDYVVGRQRTTIARQPSAGRSFTPPPSQHQTLYRAIPGEIRQRQHVPHSRGNQLDWGDSTTRQHHNQERSLLSPGYSLPLNEGSVERTTWVPEDHERVSRDEQGSRKILVRHASESDDGMQGKRSTRLPLSPPVVQSPTQPPVDVQSSRHAAGPRIFQYRNAVSPVTQPPRPTGPIAPPADSPKSNAQSGGAAGVAARDSEITSPAHATRPEVKTTPAQSSNQVPQKSPKQKARPAWDSSKKTSPAKVLTSPPKRDSERSGFIDSVAAYVHNTAARSQRSAASTWADFDDSDDDDPPISRLDSPTAGSTSRRQAPRGTPLGHSVIEPISFSPAVADAAVQTPRAPLNGAVPRSRSEDPAPAEATPKPHAYTSPNGTARSSPGIRIAGRRASSSIRASSPAAELSSADRGIAKKCVQCIVWGNFLPQTEFRSRLGVTLTEARHIYESMLINDAWGRLGGPGDPITKPQMLVHNCMNEIVLGACSSDWKKWFNNISIRRVEDTFARVTKHQCAIGMMLERTKSGSLLQLPVGRSPQGCRDLKTPP